MNQAEAAEALGCSEAHVSRIVSGERRPSAELIFRIEREFRWPPASQLDAIKRGVYHIEFTERLERIVRRA